MDDPAGEDDDYFDDDLDALPDHAFHQMQQNAIQSTQQPSLSAQVQLPTVEQPNATHHRGLPIRDPSSCAAHQSAFQAPSSDYGDFDENMLEGEIFDATEEPALATRPKVCVRGKELGEFSPKEQWRLQRYAANQRNSEPAAPQHRKFQQQAAGMLWNTGNELTSPIVTTQGGEAMLLKNETRSSPPLQEPADVNSPHAQVQMVSLLKLRLKRLLAYTSNLVVK